MLFCSDQGEGTTIKVSLAEKTCSSSASVTQETDDYESEDDSTLQSTSNEAAATDSSIEIQSPTGIQIDNSEVIAIGKTTGIIVMRDKDIQKREARWRIRKLFRNSVQKIQGRERNERNMESYAIKRALQLQSDGQICFTPVSENIDASYPPCPEDFVPDFSFNKGWAKRPQVGKMYGPKYLEPYKIEIENLYNCGEHDKKNKMSPAQMLERIQCQHPKEFCLPSENDIRAYINKLQMSKKKGGGEKTEKVADQYTSFLQDLAHNNPDMKPAEALLITKNNFPIESNPNLPTDSKIKSKFSYCKTRLNKR